MTSKIFINYRRGDDPGNTGRLFDRLQDVFRPEQLFLDVDNIAPGLDFVQILNERVGECDILLAVIGKGWMDARDASGNRRLDDPDDFVRIEISSALNQGKRVIPVLVGDAQMPRPEDLPQPLQPLARRNAVRLTHERFRADTQGLVKALQQSLNEIENDKKARAQAEAERRAADERRRVDVERTFAAAQRANTIAAIEAFQSAYPDSHIAGAANQIKATLLARVAAHRQAMAADDVVALKSFCATYQTGADVRVAKQRLRVLQGGASRRVFMPAGVAAAALAAVALAVTIGLWPKHAVPPANQEVQTSANAEASAAASAPAIAQQSESASDAVSRAAASATPSLDQIAWSLVKETRDVAAIKRFITQFPQSALRPDAEARIAALEAALVGKDETITPAADQMAWDLVKNSKEADQIRAYLSEFPNSTHRADAEQLIAGLTAARKTAIVARSDPHELARSLQFELRRVGCFNSPVSGAFDEATKAAWQHFIKLTSINVAEAVSAEAINAVRAMNKRVCPLVCSNGQHAEGDICVVNAAPSQPATQRSAQPQPSARPQRAAIVDHPPFGTVTKGGVTTCGRNGCQFVPKNCYAVSGMQGGHGLGGKIICP
jgi:hypothetical protein